MLGISFLSLFPMRETYTDDYWLLLVALTGIGVWFNWQYSVGKWPAMTFMTACCYSWTLCAVLICITGVFFADKYNHALGEMLTRMWERTPMVFIKPIILTPISLLIWRWLFKEPRQARQNAATTITN